jgi:hypothetical protein
MTRKNLSLTLKSPETWAMNETRVVLTPRTSIRLIFFDAFVSDNPRRVRDTVELPHPETLYPTEALRAIVLFLTEALRAIVLFAEAFLDAAFLTATFFAGAFAEALRANLRASSYCLF